MFVFYLLFALDLPLPNTQAVSGQTLPSVNVGSMASGTQRPGE